MQGPKTLQISSLFSLHCSLGSYLLGPRSLTAGPCPYAHIFPPGSVRLIQNFPIFWLLWRWIVLVCLWCFMLHERLHWCLCSPEQKDVHQVKFTPFVERKCSLPLPQKTQLVTVSGLKALAKVTALISSYKMKHCASKVTWIPLHFFLFCSTLLYQNVYNFLGSMTSHTLTTMW